VEDWNEYGELKQHVTMYYDEYTTPAKGSVAPTPSGTPSKPPVNQKENQKPVAPTSESSKAAVEPLKPLAGGQPTSFTLAMRQVGQEAAQKAKEVKKMATETFVGVGKAEPGKKDQTAKPSALDTSTERHTIETTTYGQSPTSTTWSREVHGKPVTPRHSIDKLESMQSPNSTAWKPTDIDLPITMHRGSSVSEVSAECIKQVEDDETIPEEDEDAVED